MNITLNAREDRLDGRLHLVTRIVLKPYVHGEDHYAWNGIPITNSRPVMNGRPVSARTPERMVKYAIGVIYNADIERGHVVAEAWIDSAKAERLDYKIIDALKSGRPLLVSSAFTANATTNFRRPDHVMVVVDDYAGGQR